ncbi:MAG: hypothetical protein K0R17_1720 [Rariglobus sp.]|jgi:hypothetical protein|nr:hypothetical protein [Rariglobus sp.]
MKLRRRLTDTERKQLGAPSLRLFASIDLEGSTAFKQTLANRQNRTWLSVVLNFVDTFEQSYWQHIGTQALDVAKTTSPKQPRLWKILGDELVFAMEIKRPVDAAIYIDALAAAIKEWNRLVLAQRKNPPALPERPLLVKGAAWLAGFPVNNAVLPIAGNHHDYIGPSMDTGFRLARLASPRRLALAVELAWLLLDLDSSRQIEFAGRTRELKGVAADSGYPQLWIEVAASEYHAKEHQVLKQRRCDLPGADLRDLCASFIRDFGVPPDLPHIPGDKTYTPPPGYQESLRGAHEDLATRYLPLLTPAEIKVDKKTKAVLPDALMATMEAELKDAARPSPPSPGKENV